MWGWTRALWARGLATPRMAHGLHASEGPTRVPSLPHPHWEKVPVSSELALQPGADHYSPWPLFLLKKSVFHPQICSLVF